MGKRLHVAQVSEWHEGTQHESAIIYPRYYVSSVIGIVIRRVDRQQKIGRTDQIFGGGLNGGS
jgi:hypothetical protein